MNFAQTLTSELSHKHLLNHPFYKAWNAGAIPIETLRAYAAQYYKHVRAFPRYLSATHAGCEDLQTRQILLENLIDEEQGSENHPELWLRFAEGLGMTREDVEKTELWPETKALIETFERFSRRSAEEGLGVLFAYEHQVPEVAQFKIEALHEHYGIKDERSTAFFKVHLEADVYHTRALAEVLEKLSPEARQRAKDAAAQGAEKLWGFLDAVQQRMAA